MKYIECSQRSVVKFEILVGVELSEGERTAVAVIRKQVKIFNQGSCGCKAVFCFKSICVVRTSRKKATNGSRVVFDNLRQVAIDR
jgi:hypothetical protein